MKDTLAGRLTLALMAAFTIFIVAMGTIIWFSQSAKLRADAERRFIDTQKWTQSVFAEPLWNYDGSLIAELAHSMLSAPAHELVGIRVYDRSGELLYTEQAGDAKMTTLETLQDNSRYLYNRFRVSHQNEPMGEVELYAKPQVFADYIQQLAWVIWVSALVVLFALGVITNFTIKRILSRPLAELIDNMKKVETLDYTVNLSSHYRAELKSLATSFQSAIAAIADRDCALQRHSMELENLVEKRTQELDRERMSSVHLSKLAALGEVSGGIAHEINNPLTVIGGSAFVISSLVERGKPTEEIQFHLDKVIDMVHRISSIIDGLKHLAYDGSQDPPNTFSVRTMLDAIQPLIQFNLQNRRVTFSMEVEEGLYLWGRETQISQVIINLVQNAIHAAHEVSNPRVRLAVQAHDSKRCRIIVEDNGEGIAPHLREKIFQPFFTTKGFGNGTGLGLSISHSIVRQHGGEISFSSRPGHTEFICLLPMSLAEQTKMSSDPVSSDTNHRL